MSQWLVNGLTDAEDVIGRNVHRPVQAFAGRPGSFGFGSHGRGEISFHDGHREGMMARGCVRGVSCRERNQAQPELPACGIVRKVMLAGAKVVVPALIARPFIFGIASFGPR